MLKLSNIAGTLRGWVFFLVQTIIRKRPPTAFMCAYFAITILFIVLGLPLL